MPRKPSIQKLIQDLEPNELREVIKELCNLDPKNKQFLTLYLQNSQSSDIDGVIEEAKKRINKHLYGRSMFPKSDLAGARKTVVEYTKILKDYPILAADLKLYYVESGTEIINDFGEMHKGFYSSMESMF
ncbi:MAG: hypothetical protein EA359_10470 [Balneolaceae bacterium]|nr:MAG: hypothetical protein EA359_10470 [Balneolaceae bacterium]